MTTSVIIPVYNRCEVLLSRSLPSVLAQTNLPDEVIIVDDGSTDELALLIEERFVKTAEPADTHAQFEFGGIKILLIIQENQGVSSARNTGIRAARSEWIAFLDSDDEWDKEKLERQMAHLQNEATNPLEAKLSHTAETWLRNDVPVKQPRHLVRAGDWIFEQCVKHCCIGPSTALIHRDVFSAIGLFDTALPVCEDYDLWLRITATMPVAYLAEPLTTKHGGHPDQLSSSVAIIDQYRVQALINLYRDQRIPKTQRELVRAEAIRKLRRIISGAHKHNNALAIAKFTAIHDRLRKQDK